MSNFFAIQLIRWITITIGLGFIIFVLIKYMSRLKKNKINSYIFQDVHVVLCQEKVQIRRELFS